MVFTKVYREYVERIGEDFSQWVQSCTLLELIKPDISLYSRVIVVNDNIYLKTTGKVDFECFYYKVKINKCFYYKVKINVWGDGYVYYHYSIITQWIYVLKHDIGWGFSSAA